VRFTCGRKHGTSSVTSRAKIRNTASDCITCRIICDLDFLRSERNRSVFARMFNSSLDADALCACIAKLDFDSAADCPHRLGRRSRVIAAKGRNQFMCTLWLAFGIFNTALLMRDSALPIQYLWGGDVLHRPAR
jgi:hypothetical protein